MGYHSQYSLIFTLYERENKGRVCVYTRSLTGAIQRIANIIPQFLIRFPFSSKCPSFSKHNIYFTQKNRLYAFIAEKIN